MKFYNYPDPIVRTTIYQAVLNLLHNSRSRADARAKTQKDQIPENTQAPALDERGQAAHDGGLLEQHEHFDGIAGDDEAAQLAPVVVDEEGEAPEEVQLARAGDLLPEEPGQLLSAAADGVPVQLVLRELRVLHPRLAVPLLRGVRAEAQRQEHGEREGVRGHQRALPGLREPNGADDQHFAGHVQHGRRALQRLHPEHHREVD